MSNVGEKECVTQNRIINLFRDHLNYKYLDDFKHQEKTNIEVDLLKPFLKSQGYNDTLINEVLDKLKKEATLKSGYNLYDANKNVYRLLRYGVRVKEDVSEQHQTVWLIDWKNPEKNNFAIAEEVKVIGRNNKRPDIVLYINGIALGVLELKSSTISVTEGIRQNLLNQRKDYIAPFFTTMQFVMAGNNTQGLHYGTIETPEKYYREWKEDGGIGKYKLDRHLSLLCEKHRFLELIHNFIAYDIGTKKLCRHNQYFGTKAAQDAIRSRQGGIIWHTQGSGKSLLMVWLAKWMRENVKDSRVLIITDRTELDEQIESIYAGVDEQIYRTRSGADLVHSLNDTDKWLICSLIHKFASSEDGELSGRDVEKYAGEIQKSILPNFQAKGDIYVFVDECHRTQSGKLHTAMKKILPNALFIGFTGTPLLKKDKKTSFEVFGPFIHTYKYDEALKDGVVVDLIYQAHFIEQYIESPEKLQSLFDKKTQGLNDFKKAELKKKWGKMQKVLGSQSRLAVIAHDILLDMEKYCRLANGRGNAIFVASSIYQACKLYEILEKSTLHGKCALVTSYQPSPQDIKNEITGEGQTAKLRQYNIYRKMLADFFEQSEDKAMYRVKEFERKVKDRFTKEPARMRLLIVVDKLLTGFNAPSATYLYIDKSMKNHGLFQAISRVNRVDNSKKEYGYIIDYKDLFNSIKRSILEYTDGAFDKYDKEDITGLLQNRLKKAKEQLEETRDSVKALCKNVATQKNTVDYIDYFCVQNTGESTSEDTSEEDNQKAYLIKRTELYKKTGSFMRAFAEIASEMEEAGYSSTESKEIRKEVQHFAKVREEIKVASGDRFDMKVYEPDMIFIFDTYIKAKASEKLGYFEDLGLIELIAKIGLNNAINALPTGIRESKEAIAATIKNNMRQVMASKLSSNPEYYKKLSEIFKNLIKQHKAQAIIYKNYLQRIKELAQKIYWPEIYSNYPKTINTPAKRALYDNLESDENLALRIDKVVKNTKKDDFRGNIFKERELEIAICSALGDTGYDAKQLFGLVKIQDEY